MSRRIKSGEVVDVIDGTEVRAIFRRDSKSAVFYALADCECGHEHQVKVVRRGFASATPERARAYGHRMMSFDFMRKLPEAHENMRKAIAEHAVECPGIHPDDL